MGPVANRATGGEHGEAARKWTFDWMLIRKAVCDHYFRGRSAEHCPDCKDRMVCFRMIDETLHLVWQLKALRDTGDWVADPDQTLAKEQGAT